MSVGESPYACGPGDTAGRCHVRSHLTRIIGCGRGVDAGWLQGALRQIRIDVAVEHPQHDDLTSGHIGLS
jgi:hypothetical protein